MHKKPDLLPHIPNIVLAFLIGLSGVGCLCTAFSLDVSAGGIVFACLFWAIVTNAAMQFRRGGLVVLGLLLLWGYYFYKAQIVTDLLIFTKILANTYHAAYGWNIPDILRYVSGTDVTQTLMLIGALCSLVAGLSLVSGKGTWAILATVLPVIPCVIVTDTVPATQWLFLTVVIICLLLMTAHVRRVDMRQASRLTAMLLVPIVLICGLLFSRNPRQTYDKTDKNSPGYRIFDMIDKLPLLEVDENGEICLDFEDLPEFTMPNIPQGSNTITTPSVTFPQDITLPPDITLPSNILAIFEDMVSLEHAGPRNPGTSKVMTVQTTFRGTLYLRGRGYDIYEGTHWGCSDDDQVLEISPSYVGNRNSVSIATSRVQGNFFVPYYSFVSATPLPEGRRENADGRQRYSYSVSHLRSNWQHLWQEAGGFSIGRIDTNSQYLLLPDTTKEQAAILVEQLGITQETDITVAAQMIESFVKGSAAYDLNTAAMPEYAEDFAIWFLTESETGYCVHFATAAAVLLRAAGIPARYVEGYIAPVSSYVTTVTAELAHAWVEYYVPDVGWVVMEATPSGGSSPVVPILPTEPTEPTEPTAPTESTVTTPPTIPTEPTVPTEPTEPTAPTESTVTTPPTIPTQPTAPTQSTAPAQTSQPATSVPPASQPGGSEHQVDHTALWVTLATVFLLLGMVCALVGQWQLRLWLKQYLRRRGDANQQAVTLWKESRLLAKLRRQKVPTALRDLAWKAKYSQHTITEEELEAFYGYLNRAIEHLKRRPWYLRILYRLIFAAY